MSYLRWVTCFSARSDSGGNLDMLRIAVETAITRTPLPATVVLDDPGGLVEPWLLSRGVEVIHWRSRWLDRIEACRAPQDRRDLCSAFAPGTMIRLELADVAEHRGWEGQILYTDHDVWFRRDPTELLPQIATSIGACPEHPSGRLRGGSRQINAGVLLIDLEHYRAVWPEIRRWVDRRLDHLLGNGASCGGMDQATLNQCLGRRWTTLSQRLNAMPWWGDATYDAGVIVHMHGLKPWDRHRVASMPESMRPTAGGAYQRACDDWEWLRRQILGDDDAP